MTSFFRLWVGGAVCVFFVSCPLFFAEAKEKWKPLPVPPEYTRLPLVQAWTADFIQQASFLAFDKTVQGGGFLAVGDLDGDHQQEVVVGAGKGMAPEVRIFSRDGLLKWHFLAYPSAFQGGVRIAVADTDGDGLAEIITAPGPGIAGSIHVYDQTGRDKIPPVIVYGKNFIGGVRVAAGDLDGDGKAEIITTPGPGGGPHVSVMSGMLENLGRDFFPYDASMTDGVTIALVKSPQGISIVTGIESWSLPLVKRFVLFPEFKQTAEFLAFDPSWKFGVTLAAFDVDHDGYDEIAVVGNGGSSPEMRLFDAYGTLMRAHSLLDAAYRGGFSLVQADSLNSKDMRPELLAIPTTPIVTGPVDTERSIQIDISEQRLYAYEHGRIAKSFLVSTGVRRHPTPIGKTTILKKVPVMDYRWNYGPGNPDNYDLPNVRFNLKIFSNIFIHTAYWHNNFGHPMSHGCVNTSLEDAKWVYNWAEVGTPVETKI